MKAHFFFKKEILISMKIVLVFQIQNQLNYLHLSLLCHCLFYSTSSSQRLYMLYGERECLHINKILIENLVDRKSTIFFLKIFNHILFIKFIFFLIFLLSYTSATLKNRHLYSVNEIKQFSSRTILKYNTAIEMMYKIHCCLQTLIIDIVHQIKYIFMS